MRTIALLILAIAATGCRTVEYVPVETVRIDSTSVFRMATDRIIIRDSIAVETKGDTVWSDRTRYIYRDRQMRDTLRIVNRDSIRVPYPVECQLSRWERFKMDAGGIAIGVAVCAVIALIIAIWIRKRNRVK